jgi:Holliday junction resolvase-like predicted endonuclease
MSEISPSMVKSTRHSKIAGNFGEALLLYWLSKHGFECATVDHTGIDLIARNPHTRELMGISVKSRTRAAGTEAAAINIRKDQFVKAEAACHAFGCVPYFALVADTADIIRVFVLSMSHLRKLSPALGRVCGWKMTPKAIERYKADSEIKVFELNTKTRSWWNVESSAAQDP